MKQLYRTGLIACALLAALQATAQTQPTEGEQVDLGLSVDWRGYNLGAKAPTEKGDTYSFASLRKNMGAGMYEHIDQVTGAYTFPTDGFSGNPKYDAAAATTDGKWRMPTREEWIELAENCTASYAKVDGVNGLIVKSKKNGNSIFFPQGSNFGGYYNFFIPQAVDQNTAEMIKVNSLGSAAFRFANTDRNMSPAQPLNIRPVCEHYTGPGIEDIEVSCDKSDIFAGTVAKVTYTLIPAGVPAAVSFASSDEAIATVDREGVVLGIGNGEAVISVSSGDVVKTVKINVTKVETDYTEPTVDLGLSVKWATWNLGATSIAESGNAYPWGYLEPGDLTREGYGGSYKVAANDICGDVAYDAVAKESGGLMRLPDKDEFDELIEKCYLLTETIGDVKYLKATSTVNGKSILFPFVQYTQPDGYGYKSTRNYCIGTANASKVAWCYNMSLLSVTENFAPYYGQLLRGVLNDSNPAGIDEVGADADSTYDVMNLQGVILLRNADADAVRTLSPGIYIIRGARVTRKIVVR